MFYCLYRIYGPRQAGPGFRYTTRSVSEQEMGIQLVRIGAGTDYVQILGALRRPPEVSYR